MDNNRTILAVVLIVLLWSAYSIFFAPQQPVSQVNTTNQKSENVQEKVETQNVEEVNSRENVAKTSFLSSDKKNIKVENDYFNIEFSTLGASIDQIDLKNYKETNFVDSENYVFFKNKKSDFLTIITSGSEGFSIPIDVNYKLLDHNSDYIKIDKDNYKITFYANGDNFDIYKSYILNKSSYSIDIEILLESKIENNINGKIDLTLITPFDLEEKSELYTFIGAQTLSDDELIEDKPKDLDESPKVYKNNLVWSGFTNKYFINILNPLSSFEQVFISYSDNTVQNKFSTGLLSLTKDKPILLKSSVYFGPKELEILSESHHQYEKTINYGFFHPLAKPLMVVLKFFYGFIGNYGFSIILLTVCIKLIFWPLTQKSYKSMKGMQKLQPEMKRLREKYGSDKQRLNQEMMTFYKENKVNPMGGCLPMLIQIPVFFALYRVLLGSIELRHAPFMLWITDLSAKDPYYVTPLIMGVTMFLQQKMTPTNMDPTQEKIMLMMPVIFTFMFLNFPSGLVVYWLVNNVLTILQQYLIRRQPD